MKNYILGMVISMLLLCSCGPRVVTNITATSNYSRINNLQEVKVLEIDDAIPVRAEQLGSIKIGDTGFSTNCNYETVIFRAQEEAGAVGGNIVKLTNHIPPSLLGSSCHRIEADIYRMNYLDSLRQPVDVVVTAENADEQVITPILEKKSGKSYYSKVRLSIAGGWSHRIAKIGDNVPDDFKDYMKDLKSGYTYNADFTYFFNQGNGLGLRFSQYKSKNSIDNIYFTTPDGSTEYGSLSDNITITCIGPMWATRMYNRTGTNCFIGNLGIGYMGYKNNGMVVHNLKQTGSTVGGFIDLGYDFGLSDDMALGLQLSYYGGKLMQIDQTYNGNEETIEFEDDQFEGLGRIELTVALRFNL